MPKLVVKHPAKYPLAHVTSSKSANLLSKVCPISRCTVTTTRIAGTAFRHLLGYTSTWRVSPCRFFIILRLVQLVLRLWGVPCVNLILRCTLTTSPKSNCWLFNKPIHSHWATWRVPLQVVFLHCNEVNFLNSECK